MNMQNFRLETHRLIIKEITLKDAPFFLKLANDPAWIQFIGDRNIHTIKDAKNYITTKIISSYTKNGFGFYLVKTKVGNHSIGITGLIIRDGLENIDVGFAFLPEYRSKGYAYEATKKVLHYAKTKLNINPIVAITDIDNIKSGNLLERLGFKFDKLIQLPKETNQCKLFITID